MHLCEQGGPEGALVDLCREDLGEAHARTPLMRNEAAEVEKLDPDKS